MLDWLRQLEDHTPVLFVTSRDAEADIVEALRHGADDFLVKPPRRAELLARLKALKRRAESFAGAGPLVVAPFEFDPGNSTARRHGELLELTERQFQLALVLFAIPAACCRASTCWRCGASMPGASPSTLDIHVSQLRTLLRLGESGWRINSVYAHGYRLEPLV